MSIRLSAEHGLNPSIGVCFFCLEDKNEVVLPGMLPGDAEAPHRGVWNYEPCDKCADFMEQGVILVSVDEKKSDDPKNPWRTGGWAVVREEMLERLRPLVPEADLIDGILKGRFAFLSDAVWDLLGLPRG